MTEIPDPAIEADRRRRFLEELDADFEALKTDPASWADEQAERLAWDATLADGLE